MGVGRIVILNGAPRSGKSSIAAAMRELAEEPWLNIGVDTIVGSVLPSSLRPGIGLRPGGERPDLEPLIRPMYSALFQSVAAFASNGFNVVVDLGIHDHYQQPQAVWNLLEERLSKIPYLAVRVRCSAEELLRRRRDTHYPAEPGIVQRWEDAIDAVDRSTVEVDTSLTDASGCAKIILDTLPR